ncbi:MAG TPA: Enamidase, partial [Paracoccaceae bacterium]|nr:Enamidase [Paracoccaceae bacterium]
MADAAPQTLDATHKLVIRNIGLMLSGKIEQPIYDADCLIAVGGKITAWGREKDMDTEGADTLIDANGSTLCP